MIPLPNLNVVRNGLSLCYCFNIDIVGGEGQLKIPTFQFPHFAIVFVRHCYFSLHMILASNLFYSVIIRSFFKNFTRPVKGWSLTTALFPSPIIRG